MLEKVNVNKLKRWVANVIDDEFYNFKSFNKEYHIKFSCYKDDNPSFLTADIQVYYCEEYNRAYIYYDINERTHFLNNQFNVFILRINSRLLNNMYIMFHVHPVILGPNGNGDHTIEKRKSNCGMQYLQPLTLNTIAYWKCSDGYYRFIEDDVVQDYLRYEYFMTGGTEDSIAEMAKEAIKINNKYDYLLDNSHAVPSAFEEYNELYKKTIGKELLYIQDEVQYIHLIFNFSITYK